jgi:hypothetical protein
MKKLVLIVVIAFASASSFAQDTEKKNVVISVGAELAAPVGNLGDASSFGLGATAQLEYMATSNVGLTLNAGYINYFGKDYTLPGYGTQKYESLGQIPVLAGARYYFIKDIYISGQLGFSSFTKDRGTGFSYAPGIGIKFSVLDATLKYLGTSRDGGSLSNVGLRIAYSF